MKKSILEPMKVIKVDGREGKTPAHFNEVFGKDSKPTETDSVQANREFIQLQDY